MAYLTVLYKGAHRFEVNVEGHRLMLDEGDVAGGRDAGPAVAGHYRLSAEYPPRVAAIDVTVNSGAELPEGQRVELLKAVKRCMVGNTLRMPPVLNVMVAGIHDRRES